MPVYKPTPLRFQSIVRGGQRRILKRGTPVVKFIRQSVEAGTYRTTDELEAVQQQRYDNPDDLRNIMRRFRQDIVRGSNVHDYPDEYLILQQHPPIPDPPRTPKKLLKKLAHPESTPVSKLTRKYMKKFSQDFNGWSNDSETNHPVTADEFYRRLLGVQAAQARHSHSPLSHKPAIVQTAYAAALNHYQQQRTIPGLSDADAMKNVEQMLQDAQTQERTTGQERAEQVTTMRTTTSPDFQVNDMRPKQQQNNTIAKPRDSSFLHDPDEAKHAANEDTASTELQDQLKTIFNADASALEGMMRWSERLQAVPYVEWTVGAATALDHWIARRLLDYSEETWQLLLEGVDPDSIDMGKSIILVRESLFPETVPTISYTKSAEQRAEQTQAIDDDLNFLLDAVSKSARNKQNPADHDLFANIPPAADEVVEELVHDLNRYRERHHNDEPYEEWNDSDKKQFDGWMRRYVKILSQGKESGVDYNETRQALLDRPPVAPEESSAFWDQLKHEGLAEALLDVMVEYGAPPGATGVLHDKFMDLPREEQIQRLLNLGALRPLLDEYTKESERKAFIQRHANTLLVGVPLDYLVSDAVGPIGADDLPDDIRIKLNVREGDRFRIETRPFQSNDHTSDAWNKSRALYQAWSEFKAGRARYEESLFQSGRLGLRYSDNMEEKMEEDENEKKK